MKDSTIFAIIGILCLIGFGFYHEQVHVAINSWYGIESKIKIDFPDLVTQSERKCEEESCRLAHHINEVVSYNLLPFFILVFIGLCIIIVLLEEKPKSF